MIEVTKQIEFDAGHRVPDHESKCRSPHGHRYRVEATITGPILEQGPETGMVIDFGRLKELLMELVHDPWDHAFLVHDDDQPMLQALYLGPAWKYVELPLVPTAENLAAIIGERLRIAVTAWHRGLELIRVTVFETPTCSATWTP